MTDHPNEARPPVITPEGTATHVHTASIVAADEDRTQARCKRCHAPLSRPESVAAELGPVCRHAVDLDPLEAVTHG